jgi:phosphohistidine phosphatase
MKLLSVLRHAKSSWKEGPLEDHDRPLNARGVRDAPRIGALILEERLRPDIILASSAVRARETALAVAGRIGFPEEVRLLRQLYLAEPGAYLESLRSLASTVGHAMVVGHNPGVENLVSEWTCGSHAMPTAALAVLEVPVESWSEVSLERSARLRGLWTPRDLD